MPHLLRGTSTGRIVSHVRHNAVIVTMPGYVLKGISLAPIPDIEGFRDSLPEIWRPLLVGPIRSVVNDDVTYVFAPDGSKEGWRDSDAGDRYRQQFMDLFSYRDSDGSSPFDVLHVRYGGDAEEAHEPEIIAENGYGVRIDSGPLQTSH